MSNAERVERVLVLNEAKSWIGTPFHHEARIKGRDGGVDCAMLLAEIYERAGVVPRIAPEHYPHDWHLHRDEEKYLRWIERFAVPTDESRPGDVAIFRIGRTWSHGGVIIAWPVIIHAWYESGVEQADISNTPQLGRAAVRFFTLKGWQ